MSIKTALVAPFAKKISASIQLSSTKAVDHQNQWMQALVRSGEETIFGKDHHFSKIKSYEDFKKHVPIVDYEDIKSYIELIIQGKKNVLRQGQPLYFAKTSGTTSGAKYIPLTQESIPNHFGTARNALFNYGAQKNDFSFIDGNQIFLSGSPILSKKGAINTGRLSGIVNHQVPKWLRLSQLPSYETNCIEEWEIKLQRIVEETEKKDLRLISGIPPWVVMYFERLLEYTGKSTVLEVFPNFKVFVYGGVNYDPYRDKIESLIGGKIDSIETYPASEGFIAFQDTLDHQGLLLNTHSGIFFEFIPADEIFNEQPTRLSLADVEIGVNYAIIINNNAGLYGYNIGDTIQFVSKNPYRIVVTGRVKHFISAFGEHVIGKEVEEAMKKTSSIFGGAVTEFTVAPNVNPSEGGLPYHEWLIEFDREPSDLNSFAQSLNVEMTKQNIYYEDLIVGNILQPIKITTLEKGAFINYMKGIGKLGGQNKVPRLSNDRKIADALQQYSLKHINH